MMTGLSNIESFVRSAEAASFSAAARRMGLTPAAVSRNVAVLERDLGVRLFQRSTRKLALTEAGERLLADIGGSLDHLHGAMANAGAGAGEPAGVLKISVSPTFGTEHILPLAPEFLERYPRIRLDWRFENRPVDLIAEGLDAAIGGGFDLSPGVVARTLAPAHIIAVASPDYMKNRKPPADPAGLSAFDGIVMRAERTGRMRHWKMRDAFGAEAVESLKESIVFNDPAAMRDAAMLGMGVAMLAVPDVATTMREKKLVRLLPKWYADAGAISLYYPAKSLMPAKTRAFVDFTLGTFKSRKLAEKFAGSIG